MTAALLVGLAAFLLLRKRGSQRRASPGARGLDLNTASIEKLAAFCALGKPRARTIVQARPLRSWEEVGRLPGFGPPLIRDMQHAGARIGGTAGGGDRPGREPAS